MLNFVFFKKNIFILNWLKKILTFLFTFFFFYQSGHCQFSIFGKVSEKATGQPLPGAFITLQNTYKGSVSAQNGSFSFYNLPKGNYIIQVSYLGYDKIVKEIILVGDQEINFELEKANFIADEVVVSATRAAGKSPTTFTTIGKEELAKQNLGQDLPILLNQTPSVVVNSDAGTGVGYTGIRIRGTDASRINVTVNGIPLNDAESHGVYWVNMPDFASSIENIQVQRGVGTSTNGAGAFGASLSIQTNTLNKNPYSEINNSYGSFDTHKHTFKAGTGLIDNKWAFDARLSSVHSDGFIDRAFSNLNSWFISGGYYGKKTAIKVNVFSGKEQTYQAWNGIPEAKIFGDKDALNIHYINNAGTTYKTNQDSINLYNSTPRLYNQFTYPNQTDNYKQDHYQLFFSHEAGKFWNFNAALHYTKGAGYYEEYRQNDNLLDYNISPVVHGVDTTLASDIIRRRWLDNDFYGIVYSANYNKFKKINLTIGGGYNIYKGSHFGEIIWARDAGKININQRYYTDDAIKKDFNIYAKFQYQFTDNLVSYLDLQYRRIDYSFLGLNQDLQNVQQSVALNFFNPKAGLSYQLNSENILYTSYSVAHREPTRDDFTNSKPSQRPQAEQLDNIESGWKYQSRLFSFTANYFLMNYKNQLVLTGQINDVGNYFHTNIAKSYRTGLELSGALKIIKSLNLSANLTLSQNKVRDFVEVVPNYDVDAMGKPLAQQENKYSKSDISFSPNVVSSATLAFNPFKGFNISWISKYVGKQYLDNTSTESRKLNEFFVNNLLFNYSIKTKWVKEIGINLLLNNIFSERYEPNGYTFAYIYGGNRITENYYFPQAGFNFLSGVNLKF